MKSTQLTLVFWALLKDWANTETALRNQGVTKLEIDKIKTPIGIPIEAETPEEIAVSIIAEIIKIKNQEI